MKIDYHCGELLQSLSDYIDGDISPALCTEIEKHLSSCDNCRIVVDTLQKTIELYHSEPLLAADLPEEVHKRLLARLEVVNYGTKEHQKPGE